MSRTSGDFDIVLPLISSESLKGESFLSYQSDTIDKQV